MKNISLSLLVICLISCKTAEDSNKKNIKLQSEPYTNNNSCQDKPSNYCWYTARNTIKSSPELAEKLFAHACRDGYSQACLEGYYYFQNNWFQEKACLHGSQLACQGSAVELITDKDRYDLFKDGRGGMVPPPADRVMSDQALAKMKSVIEEKNPEVRFCYDSELSRNPEAEAKIAVVFKSNEQGRVDLIKVIDSPFSEDFTYCLSNVIASMRFPVGTVYKKSYKPYNLRTRK